MNHIEEFGRAKTNMKLNGVKCSKVLLNIVKRVIYQVFPPCGIKNKNMATSLEVYVELHAILEPQPAHHRLNI